MIQVTRHTVAVPYLPESLRGLRVVQLSDVHRSKLTSDALLHKAVALANAACPDLIVLTGDYVSNDRNDIAPCAEILAPLTARLGTYAILGNHDLFTGGENMARALTEKGIGLLWGTNTALRDGLHLVGLMRHGRGPYEPAKAFAGIASETPTLTLVHNPGIAELLADRETIAFAGHTHGGQIRLPFLTARRIRHIGAKHYRHGWYTIGKTRLYVNRGLGCVGLPIRFLCPPEVSVFTLEPAGTGP